jgi:ABC-2 type transport system ATP-binding protein
MSTSPADATAAAAERGDDSPIIRTTALTKVYPGGLKAVDGLDLEVREGEIFSLLGPNGAGKTTTMRLLTGFVAPTHGTSRIAGIDVQANRIEAADHLGYLPENGPLYPDMTPHGLLRFFGSAHGLSGNGLKNRIDAVIAQCSLGSVAQKPIGKLSKGFRQRVSMAQALLHDPEVLIMDEPTSGLDPNQIRGVRQLIRELGKSKTVLISTHILQEVEPVADRVLFIHDGKIVFDGEPSLMRKEGRSLEDQFHRLTAQPV